MVVGVGGSVKQNVPLGVRESAVGCVAVRASAIGSLDVVACAPAAASVFISWYRCWD